MSDAVEVLMFDLLEWLASAERSYDEVMDAWRTSCPRFPVWEEANERKLVAKEHLNGRTVVRVSASGLELLQQRESIKAGAITIARGAISREHIR